MLFACAARSHAIEIAVDSEQDYTTLLDGIRAMEYTRQHYIESNANPRMIASVAGLLAFAERNPLATPEQLSEFVTRYDMELSFAISGDPLLLRIGAVTNALNATDLPSDGLLAGTDTRVGQRAMSLLGIELVGLDGYEQSRQRMSRYDLAAIRALINRSETADALTALLAGVDASGVRVSGLAATGAAYLESVGYSPMLGEVDPLQPEVNAGLTGLPSYTEFVTIRDVDGAHLGLEAEVFAQIDGLQSAAADTISGLGDEEVPPNLVLDSVNLFQAAADPNDPNHADALAQLEARQQAVIDSLRSISDERAAIFARTLLLQQSSYPDVEIVATSARSFAGLQLQVNEDLAALEQSLGVAGSLIGIAGGIAQGDPWAVAQGVIALVPDALVLAGVLGEGPPAPEAQIFDQIVQLRQQVEGLRIEMNARFNVVDAKLDTIFNTMTTGFNALGEQIGDLQQDVDDLTVAISEARTTLERIEAALFGFAEDVLLLPLSIETNLVLNYRQDTGLDLSYGNDEPNFVTSASFFYTYATTTAKSISFAGPTSQLLTLDNAQATLEGQPIARSLNDLRRIPTGLVTLADVPVTGPITSGRVGAPAPWSQAAAAYTQLARENPWYFAYLLSNQQFERGPLTDITEIIDDGQRISTLASETRAKADLWDGLLSAAITEAEPAEVAAADIIDNELVVQGLDNGTDRLDPWGPVIQEVLTLAPSIDSVEIVGSGFDFVRTISTQGMTYRGYELLISDDRDADSATLTRTELAQLTATRMVASQQPPNYRIVTQPIGPGMVNFVFSDLNAPSSVRTVTAQLEIRVTFPFNIWVPYEGSLSSSSYAGLLDGSPLNNLIASMETGDVSGLLTFAGTLNGSDFRYRWLNDSSSLDVATYEDNVNQNLALRRSELRLPVVDALANPSTPLGEIAERLDNTSSLLDAYLTLGLADAMTRSETLRSAVRGVPGTGGLGFRSQDIAAMLLYANQVDLGIGGSGAPNDVQDIGDFLTDRVFALSDELAQAVNIDAPSFPYVEFVLADLRNLHDQAFRLAIDDTYQTFGPMSVSAVNGLMANDIGQPGRIDNQELMVDLGFLATVDYTPPANGVVSIAADGSFTYTPNPGFGGIDSFNYRLIARVDDSPNPVGDPSVRSEPAAVIVRVGTDTDGDAVFDFEDNCLLIANPSQADTDQDGYGNLCDGDFNNDCATNFLDFSLIANAFLSTDPLVDLNADGVVNFIDLGLMADLMFASPGPSGTTMPCN